MLIDCDEAIKAILKDAGVETIDELDHMAVSGCDEAIGIQRAITVLETISRNHEKGEDELC